jgi:hypothetical protein
MEIPFIDSPIDIGFAVISPWSTREYHEKTKAVYEPSRTTTPGYYGLLSTSVMSWFGNPEQDVLNSPSWIWGSQGHTQCRENIHKHSETSTINIYKPHFLSTK